MVVGWLLSTNHAEAPLRGGGNTTAHTKWTPSLAGSTNAAPNLPFVDDKFHARFLAMTRLGVLPIEIETGRENMNVIAIVGVILALDKTNTAILRAMV